MATAVATGIRLALRLGLAHHPLCHVYQTDVFGRRLRICSGCAVAVPALALGFLGAWASLSQGASAWAVAAAGATMGWAQLATYVRRGGRGERAAAKALGGFGFGMMALGGWAAPLPLVAKIVAMGAIALALVALQAIRARKLVHTCQACPWRMRWDRCPGFDPAVLPGGWVSLGP